jgi:hypothetical protein
MGMVWRFIDVVLDYATGRLGEHLATAHANEPVLVAFEVN